MKLWIIAAAATLAAGPALAQTAPGTSAPGTNNATGTPPDTGIVQRNTGTAAASGDRNQAVATTDANATEPARGASSFTETQARGRFEEKGYTGVTSLMKGDDGVWRGTASKGGATAQVWLDYKGNVGQSAGGSPASTTGTSR